MKFEFEVIAKILDFLLVGFLIGAGFWLSYFLIKLIFV